VRSDQGARYGSEQNCITSKLLAISGLALANLGTDVLPLGDKRVRVSRRRIVREVRSPASRDGVTAVYLLRSAQYQFCNCGVLCIYACRGSTCIESISGLWRATWLRKRRRRRRRPARRKRSSRRRHPVPSETHQGACAALPSTSRCCRGLMWFSDAKSKAGPRCTCVLSGPAFRLASVGL
jgi:hypothetical protein